MPARRLLSFTRRLAMLALVVTGVGLLLFVALTRTQVGRDQLRTELEDRFAETFEGRLSIGQLRGNMVQTLFAEDVRLYDPSGRLVVQVDSVIARPRWRDLFQRTVSLGRMTLLRPQATFIYDADSTWNITRTVRRRTPRNPPDDAWSFTSADLDVRDGRIATRHDTTLPPLTRRGWLWNYAGVTLDRLRLQATIEWQRDFKLIDVLEGSGYLVEENLPLHAMQGQFVRDASVLQVSEGRLGLGDTDLRFEGALADPARGVGTTAPSATSASTHERHLDVAITDSRLHFGQLRTFVPKLPLSDTLRASLRVRGPLSDLTVDVDTAARGASLVQGTATLRGLPETLALEADLRDSRLAMADLWALWPALGATPLDSAGVLSFEGEVQGRWDDLSTTSAFHTTTSFDIHGAPGHVSGTLEAERAANDSVRLALRADMDSLDIARLWAGTSLSTRLNGHLDAHAHGVRLDSLDGRSTWSLRPSLLAGRAIDTARVTLEAAPRRVDGTLTVLASSGRIDAQGTLIRSERPRYTARLRTTGLDLGPLLHVDSLTTDLTTDVALSGSGGSWASLASDFRVQVLDSATVRLGQVERPLPPHLLTATVRPALSAEPRLRVGGEAMTLTVDGDVEVPVATAAARLWREAATAWIQQHFGPSEVPAAESPGGILRAHRQDVHAALHRSGLDALDLHANLEIHDPAISAAYLPMLPVPPALDARITARATTTDAGVTAHVRRAALRTNLVRTEQSTVEASMQASLAPDASVPLITGSLEASADTLRGGIAFPAPRLAGRLTRDSLSVRLHTDSTAAAGALHLAAGLAFGDRAHHLTIRDFTTRIGTYRWALEHAAPITVSADAVTVPRLVLAQRSAAGPQRISVAGTYSPRPADTLSLRLDRVQLGPIAALLDVPLAVDATADGTLALSHTPRPTLAGSLRLDTLTLNGHVLGRLTLTSNYVPGSPDVALSAALRPLAADTARTTAVQYEENDLTLTGTARLPSDQDAGSLDLTVDAERIDAFFFEELFPDLIHRSDGILRGRGTIQGPPSRPRFGGTFTLEEGRVEIPKFGLNYEAAGTAHLDATGITLDDVRVQDPTGGRAVLDGRLLFNDYRHLSFDLRADLDDLEIIDVPDARALPFYGRIRASGTASLTGPVFAAALRSSDLVTHEESDLFIPISEADVVTDPGFIIYTDTGDRPEAAVDEEAAAPAPPSRSARTFLDGLEMDLNVTAPEGSSVHLVIDPLLGDVINAVGHGRIQLQRQEGEFATYGTFNVTSGDYLFTAGEVFVRRFLIHEGSITWDGNPVDARLDIDAAYRTRASRAGLPEDVQARLQPLIPVIVRLDIGGRASSPIVDLSLAVDRGERDPLQEAPYLETLLNQPERSTEYATSVLLTNSFLLTTQGAEGDVFTGSAFNSVSQLVAGQLNRYLAQVAPNLDLTLGVQGDETIDELDVTAGLALRLLDQRLVIRGEGVYRGLRQDVVDETQQALQGAFVVEIHLTPNVSVEAFYRRESDILSESVLTSTTGAGLSYQQQFPTWRHLFQRLLPAGEDPDSSTAPSSTAAPPSEAP